jgi:hypothetical protein
MALKLVERRGCDSGHLRGSVRGVIVDESTKVTDKVLAESMRVKREWEIDHTPNRPQWSRCNFSKGRRLIL